jgi:hypothetical protein
MNTIAKIILCALVLSFSGCRARPTYSERCWVTELAIETSEKEISIIPEFKKFAESLGLTIDLARLDSISAFSGTLHDQNYLIDYDGPSTVARGELSIFFYRDLPAKSDVLARFDAFVEALLAKKIELKRCGDVPGYVPSIIYR